MSSVLNEQPIRSLETLLSTNERTEKLRISKISRFSVNVRFAQCEYPDQGIIGVLGMYHKSSQLWLCFNSPSMQRYKFTTVSLKMWKISSFFCEFLHWFLSARNAKVIFAENPLRKINSLNSKVLSV